jgi:calcium/calmodulin-dependent protein kinase I
MNEIYVSWKEGFQAAGTVCVVMEKIDGKEMFEVIQEVGHYDGTLRF